MDYYAAWPSWKMPKWVGLTLGGVFTAIVCGSAWMIVELTRPPGKSVAAAISAAVAPATASMATTGQTPPKTERANVAAAKVDVAKADVAKVDTAKLDTAKLDTAKLDAAKVATPAAPAAAPAIATATADAPAPAAHAHASKKAKHASDLTPARKKSILAKRESKSSRQAKTSDIDRLLGL